MTSAPLLLHRRRRPVKKSQDTSSDDIPARLGMSHHYFFLFLGHVSGFFSSMPELDATLQLYPTVVSRFTSWFYGFTFSGRERSSMCVRLIFISFFLCFSFIILGCSIM
jgi:hypothetical protein